MSSPIPTPPTDIPDITSSPPTTTKRKRTGKQRQLAKEAAIAAAAAVLAAQPADVEDIEGKSTMEGGDEMDGMRKRRKLDDGEELVLNVEEEGKDDVVDLEMIKQRIPQALKSLHTILKKAKITETQRLIKKVKYLRTKPIDAQQDLKDLEIQLEAIKHINLQPISSSLLTLKLRKHPLLRTHTSTIPSLFPTTPTQSQDPKGESSNGEVQIKLENRLFSAKGVGEVVKGVIGWVIGEESAKLKKKLNTKVVGGMIDGMKNEGLKGKKGGMNVERQGLRREYEDEIREKEMREELAVDAAGWESGSIDDDDDDGNEDDEDEDEDESDDEESTIRQSKSKPIKPTLPPKRGTTSLPTSKPIKSSLFLPSLSAGYTLGDRSDDGFSDPDEDDRRDAKRGAGESIRKNRRGQRERKAIWEKKYGQNANHVKKQQEEEKRQEMASKFMGAQTGRPVGKGAVVVGDSGWGKRAPASKPWEKSLSAAATGTGATTTSIASPKPPGPAETPKAIHPSWEAARLRKEKEMAMASAPKAKKIVFD